MSRKKQEDQNQDQDDVVEEKWSKFRLLIAAAVIVVLLVVGINFASEKKIKSQEKEQVLGTEQEELPTEEEIAEVLRDTQKRLQRINPEEIISEQESINRIIQDLESLKGTTSDPHKYLCNTFCQANSDE